MIRDIRTKRGKLVGKFDIKANTFNIKNGSKNTKINIPINGLNISYTSGDGVIEEVCIPPEEEQTEEELNNIT